MLRDWVFELLALFLAFVFTLTASGCAPHSGGATPEVPDEVSSRLLEEEVNVALLRQQAAKEAAQNEQEGQTSSEQQTVETPNNPILRPGMKVSIQTVEDEAINGTFQIPFAGPVTLPYSVKVQATGQSFSEFKKSVRAKYAPFFKITPTMNISLSSRKQMVEVQGLVQKPGKVVVASSASLDEILSQAGGLIEETEETKGAKYLKVIPSVGPAYHLSLQEYYAGVSSFDMKWRGGDRIFFQSEQPADVLPGSLERPRVQLLGQVNKPGAYPYRDGQNFFHYLVLAGGPTERTDFERVEVVRLRGDERETKKYDLTDKDVVPAVEAGDIVIVHALKNNETIPNATSVLNSLATALLAAIAL